MDKNLTATNSREVSKPFRINFQTTKMTARETKVCNYIAEHSKEIIHMSITEVAEQCGVSEATLVRISKKLGYKGFQALKIQIAQDNVEPVMQFHENLSRDDTGKTLAQKIFYSYSLTLNDTLSILDDHKLEMAAKALRSARQVLFIAAGGSAIVAQDAANKLLRIGITAQISFDSNTQRMMASLLGKEDAVIAISHSGATISTLETLRIAKEAGAQTISITSLGRSPILKESDIPLFTSSNETLYKTEALASRIAEITILDTLVAAVTLLDEDRCFQNLQKTRKALDNTKI